MPEKSTTKNDAETSAWPPERIKALRHSRGQTQEAFGRDLYADALVTDAAAQKNVARMEGDPAKPSFRTPTAAVVRTLERMEAGEI